MQNTKQYVCVAPLKQHSQKETRFQHNWWNNVGFAISRRDTTAVISSQQIQPRHQHTRRFSPLSTRV